MKEIADFFKHLFEYSDFRSLWRNGSWTNFHGWLYIVSDLLIWSAYFVIPLLILFYIITKRRTVRFSGLYILFATFILICGATYFVDALMFWVPVFRFSAVIRFATGIISWITVFYVVKVLPVAFSLRSQEDLEAEIKNRRKAEEELKEKNELLQEAEKIARLCYVQWDVMNEKFTLSDSAKHILELPKDKKLNHSNFTQIVHPDDVKHLEKMIDTIFIKKFFPDFYCRIITGKDETKHILVRGEVILTDNGNIAMINGTLQDVTEQRLYIQKIQLQNQKLKDIAWIQSHKVRSPVATIMGLIQLFNTEDSADPINAQVLEGITEAAVNLDEVIKEINAKTETMKLSTKEG
jgi:PAS domain-containing protein